jgi:hypothetical protein
LPGAFVGLRGSKAGPFHVTVVVRDASGTVLLDEAVTVRLPTRSVAMICTGKHVHYLGSANLLVNQHGQLRLIV